MRQKSLLIVVGIFFLTGIFTGISFNSAHAKVINLKFANYFPPPAKQSKICEEFIDELQKRSEGRIKVQYFGGGSLLKAPAMYKGIVSGIADIGLSHVEYTSGRMPVTEICGLPLGYPSGWVANQVVNDFYTKFKPKEWNDVKVLWMHACDPNVIISKKPVRSLEDLKGMTLRAPGRVGLTVKALGATPVAMTPGEVYLALDKGVIDGCTSDFEINLSRRFYEATKYMVTNIQVFQSTFFMIMNQGVWDGLPADVKKAFDKYCGDWAVDFYGKVRDREEEHAREKLLKKGMTFTQISPEELAKARKLVKPVRTEYAKEVDSKGLPGTKTLEAWKKFAIK